ncbi:MAG: hypothetical protein AAGI90_01425, partial [Chlamydiota bacterium]
MILSKWSRFFTFLIFCLPSLVYPLDPMTQLPNLEEKNSLQEWQKQDKSAQTAFFLGAQKNATKLEEGLELSWGVEETNSQNKLPIQNIYPNAPSSQRDDQITSSMSTFSKSSNQQEGTTNIRASLEQNQQLSRKNIHEKIGVLQKITTLLREKNFKKAASQIESDIHASFPSLNPNPTQTLQKSRDVFLDKKPWISSDTHIYAGELTSAFKEEQARRKQAFYQQTSPYFSSDRAIVGDCAGPFPEVTILNARATQEDGAFIFYAETFYRLLLRHERPIQALEVRVYEEEECVYQETIALPEKNTASWKRYVTNGLVLDVEGSLRTLYGLEMRAQFAFDPNVPTSIVLTHKATNGRYRFSICLPGGSPLYAMRFLPALPWQLSNVTKDISIPDPFCLT